MTKLKEHSTEICYNEGRREGKGKDKDNNSDSNNNKDKNTDKEKDKNTKAIFPPPVPMKAAGRARTPLPAISPDKKIAAVMIPRPP